MEENEKLKKELIIYQKSTKDAFLRSASVLNTEALSLFQVGIGEFLFFVLILCFLHFKICNFIKVKFSFSFLSFVEYYFKISKSSFQG